MKIKHPVIPGMTTTIPDYAAAGWLAQGWQQVGQRPSKRKAQVVPTKTPPATE